MAIFNNVVCESTKYVTISIRVCGDLEKGRRLCPVCERVPDGRLAVPRGGGALYIEAWSRVISTCQSMNCRYFL